MQETSELYKELYNGDHYNETRLLVGNKESPINAMKTAYGEDMLISISSHIRMFSEQEPAVGSCVAGKLSVVMLCPEAEPPRQAKLVPQVRITDGERHSEWISKGVFFIDTRKRDSSTSGIETMTLTGFDAMLRTEQDYPSSSLNWPAKDIDVVQEIARFIGVDIDPRTVALMTGGYDVQYPGEEYSCRETLGNIAALYGGNFVMNDVGQLRLLVLNGMPKATRYLVDNTGAAITFGGVRILV